MTSTRPPDHRRLWRGLAVAAVAPLAVVWALWRDVFMLDASGVVRVGGASQVGEWAALSVVTAALAALFWSPSRSMRVLGYTFYALMISVGFGAASVLGVMHAFGGPEGNLAAPAWAIALLGLVAAVCVGSLLATAALIVEDVRAAGEEPLWSGAASVRGGIGLGLAFGVAVMIGARVRPGGGGSPGADAAPAAGTTADVERLRVRGLLFPLPGLDPRLLRDSFGDARAGGAHEAIDILAPRGTRVLAVEDGAVAKIFSSARGGLTVYQLDPTSTYCYYYAHLDGYAPGLREGDLLRRGDLVGFVGTTGNAPPGTPHLHFAIFRLGVPPRWWQGTPVNPYPIWVPQEALP